MFLHKKYILANELVQKMNIHIANISMLRDQFTNDEDYTTIMKMNNCNMINTSSKKLPRNILEGIHKNHFTDMSDKLPCTWVQSEYEMTERELLNSNIVIDKAKIAGKDLYVFNKDFVNMMHNKVPYILDEKEMIECTNKKQILGNIKLGNDKFFVWY